MKKILFVCTGNTCRSSMAEGILKSMLARDSILSKNYEVSSAGIHAQYGDCASSNAVKVLKAQWNIDISSHSSTQLNSKLVDEAFIIMTMTRGHKEAILSQYSNAISKVFTLKEYVSPSKPDKNIEAYNFSLDITDPFGMSEQVYKRCAEEIKLAVEKLIEKLNMQEQDMDKP